MIELGHYSLIFAWAMTLFAALALWFSRRRDSALRQSGYRALMASFMLIVTASVALLVLLVTRDFRVEYVAAYTSLDLPLVYVLTAFWGGQAGSLLFWTLLLALFGFLVVLQNRTKHEEYLPYAALTILVVQHFFLSVMLYTAHPFATLEQIPADGRGLNPLLQNFFMVIHPPLLYLGYVAFTVPFAFALAALALKKSDTEWLKLTRRWTLASWLFLTAGILLGAYWAYIELGWGGYWAWDPVENASLMPWLVGTAYFHSVMVQQRQGMFKRWNFALIILTFELCIFGTFITRSGVVSSVHAFADSNMGPLFLLFIGTSTVLALALVLARSRETRPERTLASFLSREAAFLVVNLLFLALTLAVMWGTMYPTLVEAVRAEKISISGDFFNRVTWPLALAVLVLLAAAPVIGWRKTERKSLSGGLLIPGAGAVLLTIGLLVAGIRQPVALAFFAIGSAVVLSMLTDFWRGARLDAQLGNRNLAAAALNQVWSRKRHYGALVVHAGVGLAFIGILGSSSFSHEYDLHLKKGQRAGFGSYQAELIDFSQRREANKDVVYARVRLFEHGRPVGDVQPEKQFHFKFEQPQTEISIKSRLAEDVYVVLQGWEEDGSVVIRVNVNPLISLLWLGGLLILLGAAYALIPSAKAAEAQPAAKAGADREPGIPAAETVGAAKASWFSIEPATDDKERK